MTSLPTNELIVNNDIIITNYAITNDDVITTTSLPTYYLIVSDIIITNDVIANNDAITTMTSLPTNDVTDISLLSATSPPNTDVTANHHRHHH